MLKFVNREKEKIFLHDEFSASNLIVLFGRSRIGKTRLLEEWLRTGEIQNYIFSRSIKGTAKVQLEQLFDDIDTRLKIGVAPRSYVELFKLLDTYAKGMAERLLIVIDEFPYLVAEDESLPSIIQSWLDRNEAGPICLCLLGSAQAMMHKTFLSESSPIYKRARRVLKLKPMSYQHFCECLRLTPAEPDNFVKYSMVGGIPKYWQYVDKSAGILELAESLFFDEMSFFESEPDTVLGDENIASSLAIALLHAIGRGSSKPSELAGRVGIKSTDLARPLKILLDTFLVRVEIPFGLSMRSTKSRLYHISDVVLKFWYEVYAPHRSKWSCYCKEDKLKLLRDHASKVLEDAYRSCFPGAGRYWENPTSVYSGCEFDCVRIDDSAKNDKGLIIDEVKWTKPPALQMEKMKEDIAAKFNACKLAQMGYLAKKIQVVDYSDIYSLL